MSALTLLPLALSLAAPALKDPPRKEAPLVGEWEAESYTSAGRPRPVPRPGPLRYVFKADGTWLLYRGDRQVGQDRAFFTDPKADPPTIDLKYEPAEQEGRVARGIYKVEGDRLTLCIARGDNPRPKEFESSPVTRTTIYVFKRVKPKD